MGKEHFYTSRTGYYLIFIDNNMPDGKKKIKLGPYTNPHAEKLMRVKLQEG